MAPETRVCFRPSLPFPVTLGGRIGRTDPGVAAELALHRIHFCLAGEGGEKTLGRTKGACRCQGPGAIPGDAIVGDVFKPTGGVGASVVEAEQATAACAWYGGLPRLAIHPRGTRNGTVAVPGTECDGLCDGSLHTGFGLEIDPGVVIGKQQTGTLFADSTHLGPLGAAIGTEPGRGDVGAGHDGDTGGIKIAIGDVASLPSAHQIAHKHGAGGNAAGGWGP